MEGGKLLARVHSRPVLARGYHCDRSPRLVHVNRTHHMATHPNFPEFLDIAPSRIPNTLSTQLHDTFRLHVQEEAIRMYGIAGRVW